MNTPNLATDGMRAHLSHDLRAVLASQTVTDKAIGILMERYGISDDKAFDCLTRAANARNANLCDVTNDLVAKANAPSPVGRRR